jgi:hypothetical protein
MVQMELGNSYDLLWHVMALVVPGFDPTIPISVPAGTMTIYSTLNCYSSFISISKLRKGSWSMIGHTVLHFLMPSMNLHPPK